MQLTDAEQRAVTGYVKFRERFLMESFPKEYKKMVKAGTLQSHLEDVAMEALEMESDLRSQMHRQAVAASASYEETVKNLERIPVVVDEIVQAEVLTAPPMQS